MPLTYHAGIVDVELFTGLGVWKDATLVTIPESQNSYGRVPNVFTGGKYGNEFNFITANKLHVPLSLRCGCEPALYRKFQASQDHTDCLNRQTDTLHFTGAHKLV